MDKVEEVLIKIDEMRKTMCALIEEKASLVDSEVVQVSQDLDSALNHYHELLESKKRK